MTSFAITPDERRHWSLAGGLAFAVHAAVAAMVLAWVRPVEPPVPEPVVMVELPPEAVPAAEVATMQPESQPQPADIPPVPVPPIQVPPVAAPLPRDPVVLPPPSQMPARQAAPAAAHVAASPATPARPAPTGDSGTTPSDNLRARRAEADYFSLVSAHLNRRKTYPADARQARQQGVVTVRFTVDRNGGVSGTSIKRSSGHEILDQATLSLLQRVAPLPRMPASMQRDSITLSLPIDYSLRTN